MLGAALLLAGEDTYSITNSVRLNGTSDYLSKTLTTSATTSGSIWVKRAKLGATSPIFDNKVYFTSGDALYAFGLTSTALYRDPSAWMHIFWNGTGVYVNGTLVTGSGSYTAASVTNPRLGYDGTNYFSGYLSDFAFWNGSSASLQGGATDANGVWAAKRPSAGYSFLAFGSSGALGTDTSGNGNNWTVNGFTASDQTVDTPTNNYCTINPLDWGVNNNGTITNGNLTFSGGATGDAKYRGTIGNTTGKWYWRVKFDTVSTYNPVVGVHNDQVFLGSGGYALGGVDSNGWGLTPNGYWINGGSSFTATGAFTYAAGDYMDFAVDAGNGKLWIGKNGTWSGNPDAGTGALFTNLTGRIFPANSCSSGTGATFDFQTAAPANATTFMTLCTANLTSTAVTTSGTFTGNANADGPFVWTNGNPATLTINGNAVTFGTHADKTAGGFKLRSSSASYNTSGSNTWTATAGKRFVYSATSINNAQGNP